MAVDTKLWDRCMQIVESSHHLKKFPFFLGTILSPPCRVYLVDGDVVKVKHDMDFVEANNSEESPAYIPKNTIWLDAMMAEHNWPFNLYHEAHEVRDMRRGMSYDAAHRRANAGEKILRKRALDDRK